MQEVSQQTFWGVIYDYCESKVEEMASGKLDKSVVPAVQGFLNAVIVPFLHLLTFNGKVGDNLFKVGEGVPCLRSRLGRGFSPLQHCG